MEGSSLAFFGKNPDLCNCEWSLDPVGPQICLKEQPCSKVLWGTCHVGWGQAIEEVDLWLITWTLLISEAEQHIASVVIQFQEMRDHVIPAEDSWAGLMTTCFALCSDLFNDWSTSQVPHDVVYCHSPFSSSLWERDRGLFIIYANRT